VNPLVRSVSCNCCWRNVDLDPKNLNETPLQKLQKNQVEGGGKDHEQLVQRLKPRENKEKAVKIGG
jgi:hypothetical protein